MFPVMTLTDVPEGDTSHGYNASGWCTCELFIATLGDQLHPYSSEAADFFPETVRVQSVLSGSDRAAQDHLQQCIRTNV